MKQFTLSAALAALISQNQLAQALCTPGIDINGDLIPCDDPELKDLIDEVEAAVDATA